MENAFAESLLKYGYCVKFDVGPGCESFIIGLSAYRNAERPLWLGSHFTKTQYAERFVHAHEMLCRIMDMAREDGLLAGGDDTCGFYHHRDWSKSADIVNTETTFARAMSLVSSAAAEASGGAIQVLSDPARRSYNIVNAGPANTDPAGPGAEEAPGDADRPRDE